jgi:hypothetical protein
VLSCVAQPTRAALSLAPALSRATSQQDHLGAPRGEAAIDPRIIAGQLVMEKQDYLQKQPPKPATVEEQPERVVLIPIDTLDLAWTTTMNAPSRSTRLRRVSVKILRTTTTSAIPSTCSSAMNHFVVRLPGQLRSMIQHCTWRSNLYFLLKVVLMKKADGCTGPFE